MDFWLATANPRIAFPTLGRLPNGARQKTRSLRHATPWRVIIMVRAACEREAKPLINHPLRNSGTPLFVSLPADRARGWAQRAPACARLFIFIRPWQLSTQPEDTRSACWTIPAVNSHQPVS